MHVTGAVSTAGAVVGDGPGILPHIGEFGYRFVASGASTSGSAQDTIGLSTTDETLVCGGGACGNFPVQFDEMRFVQLPFVFNEEFFLSGSFGVDASVFLNAPPSDTGLIGGHSAADFSHTVTFGPATVVDASGNIIPGVTIASDIDYSAGSRATTPIGVPAPSTVVLLASTLIVWGAARRIAHRGRRR